MKKLANSFLPCILLLKWSDRKIRGVRSTLACTNVFAVSDDIPGNESF